MFETMAAIVLAFQIFVSSFLGPTNPPTNCEDVCVQQKVER